jgi:hypothetical protein
MGDLRRAVDGLPPRTKVAMLDGIARNDIIVGAYTSRDGICPMLAAHRAGGRTSYIAFAHAWDRFAQRNLRTRRPRRATPRELLVLRAYLEASLLADEATSAPLAAAISEHGELVARRPAPGAVAHEPPASRRQRRRGPRPGDPDRRDELSRIGGWSWTRPFRRLDELERAIAEAQSEAGRADAEMPRPDTRLLA